MPRALTDRESAVLAHVVMDPNAWWTHVCSRDGSAGGRALDAEKCLANKVSKCGPDYDATLAAGGYKNRVVRQAEEDAALFR